MGATALSIIQAGLEINTTQGNSLAGNSVVAVAAMQMMPDTEAKFNLKKKFDQPVEHRQTYDKFYANLQPLTKEGDWSIKGRYYPDTVMPYLFMSTISNSPGIVPTAQAGSNPAYYTWTFTPANTLLSDTTANLRTITFEEYDGTAAWQYYNAVASKLELDWGADKELNYTLSGFAADCVPMGGGITASLVQPSALPHNGISCQVYADNVGGTMGTTQYFDVMTAKVTITPATKAVYTMQNKSTYDRFYRGRRTVDVELDVDFPSTTAFDDFRNAKYKYFQFVFNGQIFGTASYPSSTINYKLTLQVPLRYETFERDKSKEHVTAKVKGINYYDTTLGYSHKVIAQVYQASATTLF